MSCNLEAGCCCDRCMEVKKQRKWQRGKRDREQQALAETTKRAQDAEDRLASVAKVLSKCTPMDLSSQGLVRNALAIAKGEKGGE